MDSSEGAELERAIHERVEIVDYDARWEQLFLAERDRLRELCAETLLEIDHVGSTAVPGLAAKPILDIVATVPSLQIADQVVTQLCQHGYCTSAEFNATLIDARWLMRQSGGRRTHHLHLLLSDSPAWTAKIAFRDALRSSAELRNDYTRLKQKLSQQYADDREGYSARTQVFRISVQL